MTECKILILFFCVVVLLLITPIFAEEMSDKVIDKHIIATRGGYSYLLHTKHFGDINVEVGDYEDVMINDTIKFNTTCDAMFDVWDVVVIE